jgi:hypothetical protein
MLADPEELDADLIGEHPLLDDIPNRLRMRLRAIVLVVGPVAESVKPQDEWKRRRFRDIGGVHEIVWVQVSTVRCALRVRYSAAKSHPPVASRRSPVNVRLRFALAAYLRRCVINTDRGECAATASATLPMSTLARPVRPWEPSTIRLQSWSSPALTIPAPVGAASIASFRDREPRLLGE